MASTEPLSNSMDAGELSSLEKGLQDQNPLEHPATAEHKQSLEPKEGGTKGWLTVAGCAAGMFVSFGWVNCVGLFQAEYEANQLRDYSSSEVAWIPSLECKSTSGLVDINVYLLGHAVFFMLAFSPVAGKLFDTYGPRLPILIGSVMHVFGLMMTSISSKYYQILLSQSVCSGLGCSLIFTPSMTAVSEILTLKR